MKKQTAGIKGTNYEIQCDGTLINLKTCNVIKWSKDTNGYMRAGLWHDGKCKTVAQHRLLAEYFIDNPECKLQVNHKNGIKHDNRLDNLEWVTQSENALHSFANGLQKPSRPHMKKVIDTKTGVIYDSLTDAAIAIKKNRTYLQRMLVGKRNNNTNLKYYE
jgi:hypothetical protein